jgi:hypothetical protein
MKRKERANTLVGRWWKRKAGGAGGARTGQMTY